MHSLVCEQNQALTQRVADLSEQVLRNQSQLEQMGGILTEVLQFASKAVPRNEFQSFLKQFSQDPDCTLSINDPLKLADGAGDSSVDDPPKRKLANGDGDQPELSLHGIDRTEKTGVAQPEASPPRKRLKTSSPFVDHNGDPNLGSKSWTPSKAPEVDSTKPPGDLDDTALSELDLFLELPAALLEVDESTTESVTWTDVPPPPKDSALPMKLYDLEENPIK